MENNQDYEIVEKPDGTALVLEKEEEKAQEEGFYDNLSENMDDSDLQMIATDLMRSIQDDEDSRKKRDEQYRDGLEKTGLTNSTTGGADFEGSSKVFHPILTECCIDYAARASKELFPSDGPCRINIQGPISKDTLERSERVRDIINNQITAPFSEYRDELEQTLTQVPLGGSQYVKHWWNQRTNKPEIQFVPIDDMLIPFHATSFIKAKRKTQRMYLDSQDVRERIRNGLYRDIDLGQADDSDGISLTEEVNRRIEGKSNQNNNYDGVRIIFECHCEYVIDDDDKADGEPRPYIITIDKETRKILAIYRNWEETDISKSEIQWFVEYPFIRWRGAYSIGFPHIIGGLSTALTGALRAIMDSALINNMPGLLKLKGGKFSGQTIQIDPTSVNEIDTAPGIDDIRKVAMAIPFNPPSPILFQMLGWLTEQARSIVTVANDKVADIGNQAPVGTTLALIEQGSKVFSSLFARLHAAQGRSLYIYYDLNRRFLDVERYKKEHGDQSIEDNDFSGDCCVIPVSDPNIFAETQRFAQLQSVIQLANQAPQIYDIRQLHKRALKLMRIPNPDELLAPDQKPEEANAVAENVSMTMGKPSLAFIQQDHFAHIQTHIAFLLDPTFGTNPIIWQTLIPIALDHIKQHLAFAYAKLVYNLANKTLSETTHGKVEDISEYLDSEDEKIKLEADRLIAVVSQQVNQDTQKTFAGVMAAIQKIQQFQSSQAPQPQPDPSMIQAQIAQQSVQNQQQKSMGELNLAMQKLQSQIQLDEAELELKKQQLMVKHADNIAKIQAKNNDSSNDKLKIIAETQQNQQRNYTELAKNEEDNETAMNIAAAKVENPNSNLGTISTGHTLGHPGQS